MNDKTKAGPAPVCSPPPAAAVPTVEKIPAPTIAPTPSSVSCTGPRTRRSWCCGSVVSPTDWSSDFRRKSWIQRMGAQEASRTADISNSRFHLGNLRKTKIRVLSDFGFREAIAKVAPRYSHDPFPLTPALSLREREHRRQRI